MPELFIDKFLRKLMPHPRTNRVIAGLVSGVRPAIDLPNYVAPDHPFENSVQDNADNKSPVFVTARFRSGSTFLWQAFNRLPEFTAYYEPLNDRQWFDPAKRGQMVDETHRGVADYAANYDGLKYLGRYYRDSWTTQKLALGARDRDTNMHAFITELVKAAKARPLLQFNRIDFRLPYLRSVFPTARIVHLRRDARDTWLSMLRGVENMPHWNLITFEPYCRFYLLEWYRDLVLSFPWLMRSPTQTHPYEAHYLIYRLSILFARRDADFFLSYEEMNENLEQAMSKLLTGLGADASGVERLASLHAPRRDDYQHSVHQAQYEDIEARVEQDLKSWLAKDV